jgi:HPt (histidine-containing phosphotransfer) domain-containing protein
MSPSNSRVRVALVLAVAGFLLAACGGSSSAPSAQGGSSVPVQTSAAVTPTSPPTTSSAPATGGGASFCTYARSEKSEVATELQAFTKDSPAQLEKFENQLLNVATALASSAPASVKSAAKTVKATDQAFFGELQSAHFVYANLNTTAVAKLNTPAFMKAIQTIVTYLGSKCG